MIINRILYVHIKIFVREVLFHYSCNMTSYVEFLCACSEHKELAIYKNASLFCHVPNSCYIPCHQAML